MPAVGSSGPSGQSGNSGGAGPPWGNNPAPANDPNATLLAQIQQLFESNMAALRLELGRENRPNDTDAPAVEAERNLIQAGQWNGPTTPLSPTSIYVAPAPVSVSTGGGPAKPRFNPGDLPPILFGQDLEEWISHMDHMVSSFGELVVCPHILHRCFATGDPMRDWYLTKPSEVHTFVTTGDGCWNRFKTLMKKRFSVDVGLRQRAAGRPQEPEPRYGCRPQEPAPRYGQDLPQGPASSYAMPPVASKAMPPASSCALPPASLKATPPASSKAMPPAVRTASPTAAAAAELCQSLRQSLKLTIEVSEFLPEFNNRAGYHHNPPCAEAATKKYDGQLHAEKHKEKATTDGPEQRGYSTDCRNDRKLEQRGYSIERDYCGEQKPEQQGDPFECDHRGEQKLQQRISRVPESPMPPASSNTLYTDPRLSTVQASRRRARTWAGEAGFPGTIGSHLYQPRYGEKPLGQAVELEIPSILNIHPVVSIQHVEKAQDPTKDPFGRYDKATSILQIVDSRMSSRHPGKTEYLLRRGQDRTSDTWSSTPPLELVNDFEDRNAFFEAIQAPYTMMDHRTSRQGTRNKVSFGDNRSPRWIPADTIDPHALRAYQEEPQVHVTSPTGRQGVEERFESRKPRPGEKLERPILYISRQTTGGEPSYESTEREVACLYWAVNKLSLYLEGNTFTVFTDHECTRDVLQAAPNLKMSKRLDKYRMLLQPYLDDIDVVYGPAVQSALHDPGGAWPIFENGGRISEIDDALHSAVIVLLCFFTF
jgi:hypothetical protein